METFTPNRAGGAVYDHLIDCMSYLKTTYSGKINFSMNGTTIKVYRDSCIEDLVEKYCIQMNIDKLRKSILYMQS